LPLPICTILARSSAADSSSRGSARRSGTASWLFSSSHSAALEPPCGRSEGRRRCRAMASRARLVALLIGLATAAASGGFGGSEPAVERRSCARAGGAAAPTAAECGRCHAEIHAEWQDSAHGEAFTDPAWQAALARTRRPELCWPCHAPEPVHRRLGRMPAVRATHREEG